VLVVVSVLLFATGAYAAVPNDAVIIGDKAFAIGYLTDPNNASEIQQALDNADPGNIWYSIEGVTTGWTGVFFGNVATEADIAAFPQIEYKDPQGAITVYAAGNGDVIGGGGDFEVIAIE